MFLVAALGNPGPQYERHRHNVGFMVAEELRRRHGWPAFRSRYRGLFGDGLIVGERVALLLPMTYMNRSGQGVAEAARFYRIPVERVLAVHDEVELPFGEARLKEGGGLGGHNGLRSLEQHLGGRDYWRVRVGVGRPASSRIELADFVLSDFSEPREDVLLLIGAAADLVEEWLRASGSAPGGPRTLVAD
ncbi:MAG: aminoacyl-tRNA hydrolase [Thermoleophilia bacterium]